MTSEIVEHFKIENSNASTPPDFEVSSLTYEPLLTMERFYKDSIVDKAAVEALFAQKGKIDVLFADGKEKLYYRAREAIFPAEKSVAAPSAGGGKNKAADKLAEINSVVEVLPKQASENELFIDIGGGPGAWSEPLLDMTPLSGCGISLPLAAPPANSGGSGSNSKDNNNKTKDEPNAWYPRLMKNNRFRALWGANDNGDIFDAHNVERVRQELCFARVVIAIGDGGLAQTRLATSTTHNENLQELYSARVVLSQLVIAASTLVAGGTFICKMFDSFSALTTSILYSISVLFEETFIVKPSHSRSVNAERFVIGRRRRAASEPLKRFVDRLRAIHAAWDDNAAPHSVVPIGILKADKKFVDSLLASISKLLKKQTSSLEAVMAECDRLSSSNSSSTSSTSSSASSASSSSANVASKPQTAAAEVEPLEDGWERPPPRKGKKATK